MSPAMAALRSMIGKEWQLDAYKADFWHFAFVLREFRTGAERFR